MPEHLCEIKCQLSDRCCIIIELSLLNETSRSNANQSSLTKRWLAEDVQPAGRQRAVDGQLLSDLNVLSPSKSVACVGRVVVKTKEYFLGFLMAAFEDEPACWWALVKLITVGYGSLRLSGHQ